MNGILVINKPAGMTSFDVIARLRRKYKQKKFGHTGTLDPQATGVLVVLCGKACKALPYLENTDKTYRAQLELGSSTTTDDIFGEVTATKEINRDFDFQQELDRFKGPLHQKVPATSAKKVAGKKLLDYQRANQEVPEVYTDVEVYDIKALDEQKLEFEVACSSGTYIRSICRDLAANTGNLGCMKSLQRTKAGGFDISQAQDIEDDPVLYSVADALGSMEQIQYEKMSDIYNGRTISLDSEADQVLIMDGPEAAAIYEKFQPGLYKCRRGLF